MSSAELDVVSDVLSPLQFDRKSPNTGSKQTPWPAVMEEIEESEYEAFCMWPVSILCPGCGTVLERYLDGLPRRVGRFEQHCSTCETSLKRWSVLAIPVSLEQTPTEAELREKTTQYWNRHLLNGIMTGESYPRTEEYTQEYTEQAHRFCWDWTVTCPLCRKSLDELNLDRLDYHHWNRDPDRGVCLCRSCHEAISGGGYDKDQDWRAQQLGLKDKHDLQLSRLAIREQVVAEHDSFPELLESLQAKYNLMQSEEILASVLSQTLNSAEVLDQITDAYLLQGL